VPRRGYAFGDAENKSFLPVGGGVIEKVITEPAAGQTRQGKTLLF
jgi:hypothetical protein